MFFGNFLSLVVGFIIYSHILLFKKPSLDLFRWTFLWKIPWNCPWIYEGVCNGEKKSPALHMELPSGVSPLVLTKPMTQGRYLELLPSERAPAAAARKTIKELAGSTMMAIWPMRHVPMNRNRKRRGTEKGGTKVVRGRPQSGRTWAQPESTTTRTRTTAEMPSAMNSTANYGGTRCAQYWLWILWRFSYSFLVFPTFHLFHHTRFTQRWRDYG